MEVDEESNFSLHCFTTSDCMASLEDVYQPSPVSVLEPLFRGDNSPSPERLGSVNVDTSGEFTRRPFLYYITVTYMSMLLFCFVFPCFVFHFLFISVLCLFMQLHSEIRILRYMLRRFWNDCVK